MRKILSILFLCSALFSNAQSGWITLPSAPISTLRFDDIYFANDSTGWAVDGNGKINKTTDYGDSWTLQLDSPYYLRTVEFLNADSGFAGSLNGPLFKTTNGGASWSRADQAFPQAVPGICGIGHFGNTIILVGKYSSPAYILRSTDGGTSWTYYDMSLFAGGLVDCFFLNQDTVFISGFSSGATNHRALILRSNDGGLNWQQCGISNALNSYCWKLQFPSSSVGYSSVEEYSGSDTSRIMKTTDGGMTWQEKIVSDIMNIDMEGIGFLNNNVGWVGGWSNGMYETADGGDSWSYVNFGSNFNRFFFISQNLAYAAGYSIYRYTDSTLGMNDPLRSEISYIHHMDIFPNPASHFVNFQLSIAKNTHVIFEVYDINGKIIKEFANSYLDKNEYTFSWNVSDISRGIYFAALRTDEHFLTKKFTVLKK